MPSSSAYRLQYGFNSIYLLPANLYGPRDNFDPASSHVIPALVRNFLPAKREMRSTTLLWGDGSPSREFLYVEDAAEGVLLAAEHYDDPEPVNLGTGQEITIRQLAELVAQEVGYDGGIEWNPWRCLDCKRAEQRFGFRAQTALVAGLRKTIDWYLAQVRLSNPSRHAEFFFSPKSLRRRFTRVHF